MAMTNFIQRTNPPVELLPTTRRDDQALNRETHSMISSG